MQNAPALVTLDVWRLPRRAVPRAFVRAATDRRAMRHSAGVRFAKLLGTGSGQTFTPRDADLMRWALVTAWSSAAAADEPNRVTDGWRALADETWRAELRPVASRGTWSGETPFGDGHGARAAGPVLALTRARIRTRKAATFWGAVPPVSAELGQQDGLLLALGVGEAPVGLQGTLSLWRSDADLRSFARSAAHAEVVDRTPREQWYAEELFARFAVTASTGTVDGRDPLA